MPFLLFILKIFDGKSNKEELSAILHSLDSVETAVNKFSSELKSHRVSLHCSITILSSVVCPDSEYFLSDHRIFISIAGVHTRNNCI